MADGDSTIATFLLGSAGDHLQPVDASSPVAGLREVLGRQAPSIPWASARAEVAQKLREAVDVKLDDLLLSAWVRSALLVKYLDSARYPPDETVLAHLGEHTVKTTMRPSIDVYVGNVLVKTIPVEASFSLVLKGFILTIKGGHILQAATGTCQAKGKVTLAGVPLVDKAFAPMELPGVLHFHDSKQMAGIN